jgi:hypothetical protein
MLTLRWWTFRACEGVSGKSAIRHMYKSKASRSSSFLRGQIQPTCQCRHGLSAREKEAAPKQDTGALIATPEAFEMDALSTSRRRSKGFSKPYVIKDSQLPDLSTVADALLGFHTYSDRLK